MTYDLRCTRLGKQYRRPMPRPAGWRSWVHRREDATFWALHDVTFDAAPGEVVGVIGANGAGKSTLFKLLSRITAPTEGQIRIRGRLAALIEVGSGFHPELSGRENVFLSGTLLGLRRREIADRLESIAEFAGIGPFLDTPVKWYSSGMYVRLGFAVAAHLEPEILLVDEVLAVGDAQFQAKCLRRLHDLRQRGTTILFISHDLGTVERLCDRALLLEKGSVTAEGLPADVVSAYQRSISDASADAQAFQDDGAVSPVVIRGLTMPDAGAGVVDTGQPLAIEVALSVLVPQQDLVVDVMVYGYEEGQLLCQFVATGLQLDAGAKRVRIEVPSIALLPGVYTLGATVRLPESSRAIDWWFGRTTLHVERGPATRGIFHQPYRWSVLADESVPVAVENRRRE